MLRKSVDHTDIVSRYICAHTRYFRHVLVSTIEVSAIHFQSSLPLMVITIPAFSTVWILAIAFNHRFSSSSRVVLIRRNSYTQFARDEVSLDVGIDAHTTHSLIEVALVFIS